MFKVGDYAVSPGHGVGQICELVEKDIGGRTCSYFVMKLFGTGLKIMIPSNNKTNVRPLSSAEQIAKIFDYLHNHEIQFDSSTWNRRYREYMEKLKTGDIMEIATVVRSLYLHKSKSTKGLSFGEKKMLEQCRDLLAQEIMLGLGVSKEKVIQDIENCFMI